MNKTKSINRQPNQITLSRQEFTLIEKRIVYFVINRLKPEQSINVNYDPFRNIEITIPLKILSEFDYRQIRKATDKLQSRKIYFIDSEKKQEYRSIVPFPEVHYKGKEGIINITIFESIVPYFIELKKGFTEYQLKSALSLTSTITQKLYELLCRFKDTGNWQGIEISYLKKLLNIEGKYQMISAFRTYVLNASQRELKEKTDISFTYELRKTGRRFTHIDFKIHWNKGKDPFKKVDNYLKSQNLTDKQQRCKKYLDQFGIQDKKLRKSIINNKQAEFWKWLHFYKQNKANVHNPAGHLLKSLGIYQTTK